MPRRSGLAQRRPTPQKLAKDVRRLTDAGYSAQAIADELGVSKRTVQRHRQNSRLSLTQPEVKEVIEDPEVKACLEYSVQGFIRFYVRYSGQYFPWHAREWIEEAIANDRLLLNVPPRHAKSEILSVWFVIWHIVRSRNVQILVMSQTEKMARKFSNKIAWHLEFNKDLIRDFGRFKPFDDTDPWRPLQGELMVEGRDRGIESGDLTLQIKGVGQQILGMEADLIIGDDLVGRKHAWSQTDREHLSETWHGDVMSRRSPDSKVVVVGQCIHFEDLYEELAEKTYSRGPRQGATVWKRIKYPAVKDWDQGLVLWPKEWPFDRLMETYEDLKRRGNDWLFESMYQQNPLPPEARLVLNEWIYGDEYHEGCVDSTRPLGAGLEPRWGEDGKLSDERYVRVVSLDPSPERAAGLIVGDVLASRDEFRCGIIEAVRGRMDVRAMLHELARVTELYRPEYLIFEHNAFARWFLQDPRFVGWQRKTGIRVISHTTGRNKSDPNYGIQTLAPHFEFGRIRLPWGDPAGREASKLLIEEATTYPFGPYTDLLMALWFIYYNHQKLTPPRERGTGERAKPGRGFRSPSRLSKGFRWARR